MRRWRSATATACAVAASIGLVSATASGQEGFASTGGTQVSWVAPIATVTVTIDFIVSDPDGAGVREAVAGLQQQITDFWLAGLDPLKTDCLFFDLVVTMNVLAESAVREIEIDGRKAIVTTPGHHVVLWGGNAPNAPHPNTYDPYDADQVANPGEDFVTPYQHELWAVWSGQLVDPSDYAHEFGHLLGLGDDYRQSGLPIPERNGTLMDNGERIDQNLFDRLGHVIDDAGTELPCSQTWDGTVKSVVTTDGPGGPCGNSIAIEGTARFVVAGDGTVTGTYDVAGCGVSEPHAEFTGTATDAQFLFPDLIVFTNGEPIPKLSPTHAQGTFTNQQGPATTWVTTWDMVCSSCP